MKKLLPVAAALSALLGTVAAPAFAADIPPRTYTKAPPPYSPPAVIYNWTGFYIGGHLGGAFADSNSLIGNDARFMDLLQRFRPGTYWAPLQRKLEKMAKGT